MTEWTTDTLKELLEAKIDAVKENAVLALTASEKAVAKAETAAEKRFESVNEFRAQQADLIGTFMSRSESDIKLTALSERVDERADGNARRISDLERKLTLVEGAHKEAERATAASRAQNNLLVAVASVIVAVVAIVVVVILAI